MVQQRQVLKHALIILVSIALVLLTLLIPRQVKSQAVNLGYPMHFVTQDVSTHPASAFQRYSIIAGAFRENPMSVSYANFIFSILLVVLVVEILEFFSERFFYTSRKKR